MKLHWVFALAMLPSLAAANDADVVSSEEGLWSWVQALDDPATEVSELPTKPAHPTPEQLDAALDAALDDPGPAEIMEDVPPEPDVQEDLEEDESEAAEAMAALDALFRPKVRDDVDEDEDEAEDEVAVATSTDGWRPGDFRWDDDPVQCAKSDPLCLQHVDPAHFDFDISTNRHVAYWLKYFLTDGKHWVPRVMKKSAKYRAMIFAELDRQKLPRDLIYLAMVESAMDPLAYSYAHASGLWQFIPKTGKRFGLDQDWWVDQRRDPQRATRAAGEYLGEMHAEFDDWQMAMAGYNAGEHHVRYLCRKAGKCDTYWTLRSTGKMAKQTARYVPKILALSIIGTYPERYGFTRADFEGTPEPEPDVIELDGPVSLKLIAEKTGVSTKELRALNPALRRNATPRDYRLVVPKGKGASVLAALAPIQDRDRWTAPRHAVKSGETLKKIAAKYKVRESDLRRANGLSTTTVAAGTELLVPVGLVPVASRSSSSSSSRSSTSTHTVKRGESLSVIASKYKVSVRELKSWNGLRSSTIHPGQRLRVKKGSSSRSSSRTRTHTVRRGDTLSGIAAKYGVKVRDLQKWNSIRGSTIRVGQKLTVKK